MSNDPDIGIDGPVVQIFPEDREARFYHRCTDWSFENFGVSEVRLPLGDSGWRIVNENTISPSILCHNCGAHGFWTDGEWRNC
ncbi:hypothetical protein Mbo4_018 [Rhodococcus phage Mbo4]|uniref:Uncharacterized protein n=2 Tax=root TaxID=1 RepID=A0A9E7IGS3_9CAUD|nr:DUF6527 family protein [Rhodococcus opacus]YP_010755923.1 hypothetical protein QEH50_gp18 [Rhodococcus phage Mbo4]EKT83035.1 hypothetical protein WSS_A08967 [Rhodococcus opacus M213]URG17508.1 hypothetical protein Mbo4_018 [Rhodococcus phage Mbo4]